MLITRVYSQGLDIDISPALNYNYHDRNRWISNSHTELNMNRKHSHEQQVASFWSRVDKISSPNGCWIYEANNYSGSVRPQWYGSMIFDGRRQLTHRISWQITHGPIPDDVLVLHNCPGGDNPACVNPAHLWLGSYADNNFDRASKGRNSHIAKLNPDKVREIRSRWPKESALSLARAYGVSTDTIYAVITRETYRYVT